MQKKNVMEIKLNSIDRGISVISFFVIDSSRIILLSVLNNILMLIVKIAIVMNMNEKIINMINLFLIPQINVLS